MDKMFVFAVQLGILAPFWRSMQALLWANSGRVPEGALWNIVYCGGLEENLVWLGAELQKLTDYQQRRNTYRKK